MTVDLSETSQTEAVLPGEPAKGWVRRGRMAVCHLLKKRRSAQALARLSGAQLEDIGLSRSEVRAEVGNAWFWD